MAKYKCQVLLEENGKFRECGKEFETLTGFLHHVKYEHGMEW